MYSFSRLCNDKINYTKINIMDGLTVNALSFVIPSYLGMLFNYGGKLSLFNE